MIRYKYKQFKADRRKKKGNKKMKKKTDEWTKVLRVLFYAGVGMFVAMVIAMPIAISMQEVEDPVKHADIENIISTDTLTTTDSVKDYELR